MRIFQSSCQRLPNSLFIGLILCLAMRAKPAVAKPGEPTAFPQIVNVFNTPKPITLRGVDPANLSLTFEIIVGPSHGILLGTAPILVYIPTPGYVGPDSFTFRVDNGLLDSSPATIAITVNPFGAQPPVAADQLFLTTPFNATKAITLTATDPNNLPLTYGIVDQPSHGSLTGTGANLTYIPNHNYAGPDSFTFNADNGSLPSNVATIAITVDPPTSQPPVAGGQILQTAFNTAKAITLTATDPNNLPLTYSFIQPAHGTLSGAGAHLTYIPNLDYAGPDSFTFIASNDSAASDPATITLTVSAPTTARGANGQTPPAVRVYPNPWQADLPGDPLITFDHLSPASTVKIFTLSGQWVQTLPASDDHVTWDRRNGAGDYVASGLYVYVVTDGHRHNTVGKFSIIK